MKVKRTPKRFSDLGICEYEQSYGQYEFYIMGYVGIPRGLVEQCAETFISEWNATYPECPTGAMSTACDPRFNPMPYRVSFSIDNPKHLPFPANWPFEPVRVSSDEPCKVTISATASMDEGYPVAIQKVLLNAEHSISHLSDADVYRKALGEQVRVNRVRREFDDYPHWIAEVTFQVPQLSVKGLGWNFCTYRKFDHEPQMFDSNPVA